MRLRVVAAVALFALVTSSGVRGQQAAPPPQTPAQAPKSTFRSAVNLILVDVDVRDKRAMGRRMGA